MNTQNNKLCEEAKLYYYDCLCDKSCGLTPQSISNHIEQCQNCQNQINQLKVALSQKECIESEQKQDLSTVTTMLQLHFAYIGEHVTCETVRPFLPGLLDPAIEVRIPTPITAHLDNCPKCAEDLKAIQKLNLNSTKLYRLSQFFAKGPSRDTTEFSDMASVSAMAGRADSEVVTIYNIDESAKTRKAGKSDDLYTGFPISVEIARREDKVKQPVPTIDFAAALKEKISAMNLRPFIKIGVAAAAVIVIGFAMLLNTPSAKAVTLEQIYKALGIDQNVHILKLVPDETKLPTKIIEEKWVSQTLDISMSKTEKGFVFWDVSNLLIQSKNSEISEIKTNQLTEDDIPVFKQIIGSLGLMPFDDISQIPVGFKWQRKDDEIPEVAEGIEIYELTLPKRKYSSSSGFKMWRVFADAKNNLPLRTEWHTKLNEDDEFVLETVMVVEYWDESKILKAIKDAGF